MQTGPRFKNRVALITGAGSDKGIGFASACILAAGGAITAITDMTDRIHRRAKHLPAEAAGVKAFIADLTDRNQTAALVNAVLKEFHRIDILVNCAGMVETGGSCTEINMVDLDPQVWDKEIDINLNTCFNVTRTVLPHMIHQRYGRIVNVSSVTGPLVSNPGATGYSAAKAAMVGMSRSLAIEVAKSNITVNNVAPGWIATGSSTKEEQTAAQNTPMGRAGTPAEVGNLIAFLASDDAAYITGQIFVIDGGNTIQEYKGPSELYY
ncbi:MAG: SDR family NAD(P)-dependent oxidoreductase [Deltaproteobacteria bacterium]